MADWDWQPLGSYLRDRPMYEAAAAEEERRRQYMAELEQTQFQPNLLQQMMQAGGLGGGILGAIQGAMLPPSRYISRPEQILGFAAGGALGEQNLPEGLRGQGLQSQGAGILEHQFNMPEGPSIGPLNARGVLGFGIDIATDPLSYVPVGKIAGGLHAVAGGLGRVGEAAPYLRHAPEALGPGLAEILPGGTSDLFRGGLVKTAAEHIPGAGLLSPRLATRTEEETLGTGYRIAQDSLVQQQVDRVMAPFVANPLAREIDRAGGMVNGVPWQDAAARFGAGQSVEFQDLARQIARRDADLYEAYQKTYGELAALKPPPELLKIFEVVPSHVRVGEQFIGRVVKSPESETLAERGSVIGGRVGIQKRQLYEDVATGIAHGREYEGIIDTGMQRSAETFRKINEMQMAMELVKTAQPTGAGLPGVLFAKGLLFDPETAAALAKYVVPDEANPIARLGANIAEIPRAFSTGFDFGAGFIQGLVQAGNRPGDWLAAQALAVRAFMDPAVHDRLMASPLAQEVARTIPLVQFARAYEEYGANPRGTGWYGRVLRAIPGPAGEAVRNVAERAQSAFDMLGDALRVYAGAAYLPHLRAHPEDAAAIGEFLNHLTGIAPRGLEGVSRSQQATERALMFSTSYLASTFALAGDVLQGGIVGKEAANAIGNMLVVGIVGYRRMAEMTGQQPVMDPGNSRFLTVDVGGSRYGIGGAFRALASLGGQVYARLEGMVTGASEPPKPEDFTSWYNPFARYFRGRLSPSASWFLDVVNGETYNGQQITGPASALVRAGELTLPMGLQSVVQGMQQAQGPGDIAGQAAVGLLGLRTFPESYGDVRSEVAQQKFGKDYPQLTVLERAEVRADERVRNRQIPPGSKFEETRKEAGIYTAFEGAVNKAAAQVGTGEITKDQFRVRVSDAQRTKIDLLTEIPPPSGRKLSEPEKALAEYFRLLKEKDQYERTRWDLADAYLAGLPEGHQQYIEDRMRAAYTYLDPPARQLMNELRDARHTLEPYRALPRETMERFGIWDQYVGATPLERKQIEQSPRYKMAERLWDKRKESLRRADRDVDAALVEFYGEKPIWQHRR